MSSAPIASSTLQVSLIISLIRSSHLPVNLSLSKNKNLCLFCVNRFYLLVFHVAGFTPGPIPATDDGGGGDLKWIDVSQPKKKRLKEEDFLDNNLETPSVGFLQKPSVSTGLGLSIDDRPMASSGESPVFPLLQDEIHREFQSQDAEVDRLIKVQWQFGTISPMEMLLRLLIISCRSSLTWRKRGSS